MLEKTLSHPAKIIFWALLVLVTALALYWTITESGPGLWAINLQANYLFDNEYSGKLNILFLSVLGGIPAYLIALGFDFLTRRGIFEKS